MKVLNIIFFLSITTICFSQIPPPKNEKIELSYKINELTIKDTLLLHKLDTFLFQEKCSMVNNNKKGFFSVKINKSSCPKKKYIIEIEFFKFPSIHNDALGFFMYKNYSFVIYGETPFDIFSKKENSKTFVVERNTIPNIEDFPYWKFKYEQQDLYLISFDCW